MMKRSILAVVATTAAVVSFSCKQEKQPEPVLVSSAVEVTLGSSTTKAFGDNIAEDFEKELQNIVMFVYQTGQGTCLLQHEFTAFELAKKKAVFQIPGMTANTSYDFYAIANCTAAKLGNLPNRTTLLSAGEGMGLADQGSTPYFGSLGNYNGAFDAVIDHCLRNYEKQKGFIMSGMATVTSPATGQNIPTRVQVDLRRTVAKVMINVEVTEEFHKKYEAESKLKVTKTELTKLVKNTPLIARTSEPSLTVTDDLRDRPLEQDPYAEVEYKQYKNQFFIYENGWKKTSANDMRPELVLTAWFALDGVIDEENKIGLPIKYTIKLAGEAGSSTDETTDDFGLFKRNGSYLINVKINGLTENEVVATIQVMDWETLKTQDISIGEKN